MLYMASVIGALERCPSGSLRIARSGSRQRTGHPNVTGCSEGPAGTDRPLTQPQRGGNRQQVMAGLPAEGFEIRSPSRSAKVPSSGILTGCASGIVPCQQPITAARPRRIWNWACQPVANGNPAPPSLLAARMFSGTTTRQSVYPQPQDRPMRTVRYTHGRAIVVRRGVRSRPGMGRLH